MKVGQQVWIFRANAFSLQPSEIEEAVILKITGKQITTTGKYGNHVFSIAAWNIEVFPSKADALRCLDQRFVNKIKKLEHEIEVMQLRRKKLNEEAPN